MDIRVVSYCLPLLGVDRRDGLGNEAKVGEEEESLEIGRSFGYWKIGNRAWLYL